MPQVHTATGPVDTSELGQVLMHEHLFVLDPEIQQNHPEGGAATAHASPTPSSA